MTRDEAWEVVAGSITIVNNFKAVALDDARNLLSESKMEKLARDKMRNLGPVKRQDGESHPPYFYPWNIVDYLCQ